MRKPKLFFVSTSATTSTLQTLSICYVSSATPAACTGRKRRSISLEPAESKSLDGMEASHAISILTGMESEGAVQPSTINREVDGGQDREGRFLLYWITTTSISTSTSFTTTYTVSSVHTSWWKPLWIDLILPILPCCICLTDMFLLPFCFHVNLLTSKICAN